MMEESNNSTSIFEFSSVPLPPKPASDNNGSTSSDFIYPVTDFPPLSAFDVSMQVPALVIPVKRINELRKKLQPIIPHRPGLKGIVEITDTDQEQQQQLPKGLTKKECRKLVLDPRRVSFDSTLPQKDDKDDNTLQILQSLLKSGEVCQGKHTLQLSYKDFNAEEILRRLLPFDEIPSAFEVIGDLAHVNLRDELLPFKYLIGKVLLDKNTPRIRTVVNKVGTIETKYRTFGMEVIAGRKDPGWSIVEVREEGCLYKLDFQRVYWNSRLGGEHRRIVKLIRDDAMSTPGRSLKIGDMMAGIGPFAIPLTSLSCRKKKSSKKGKVDNNGDNDQQIEVYANDLNPASYEYLVINSERNKCQNLLMYNIDARVFCHQLQDEGIFPDHYIMNLPATALEFLDAFRGYKSSDKLPMIHVHCFAPKNQEEADRQIWERSEAALGCRLDKNANDVVIHLVRDVAPNKNMYCVSFRLPKEATDLPRINIPTQSSTSTTDDDNNAEEPEQKRQKK